VLTEREWLVAFLALLLLSRSEARFQIQKYGTQKMLRFRQTKKPPQAKFPRIILFFTVLLGM